ncbi:hypothetical protein SARC_09718 [Sphaeroforma arctica JP610]|uniref:MIR domain-containing protein n=1 Tax=Sphaeroforma arctica JP610 TaxID=667725 RepID=A0A0L0FPD2_9EUKA|nr:hypothetical protein SARC_09718 [Sphaeroforma arctica JP610]KNC77833.1 hypothetical protein SARC_09718 [Sphaeroforma arctica JP610]|eukprot:XP_014151735.1 hypothetical protein SARC_09718 [Sphaeroforma arctica JP610]
MTLIQSLVGALCVCAHMHLSGAVQLAASDGFQAVTCGSSIKLMNVQSKMYMHSHEVSYGTGSKQQSVTSVPHKDDVNSMWVVRGTQTKPCSVGKPVMCGDTIRLTHGQTNKNFHSHLHVSPLSRQQEISAYGNDGEGDLGDEWVVVCDNQTKWLRGENVFLKHNQTGKWASTSKDFGYGRPIEGQYEVAARSQKDSRCSWIVKLGIFMRDSEE